MRISKKERNRLAILINSIHVAEMMRGEFRVQVLNGPKGDGYKAAEAGMLRWEEAGYRHQIELADQFGIELPGLQYARAIIERRDNAYEEVDA